MPMSELKKKTGERRNGFLVAKEEMEEEEEKVTLKRPVFRIWVRPNSRNVCSHARKLFHNMRIEQGKMPLYHDLLLKQRGRMQV